MIVILGESASGKTTLAKMFIEANPKYKKVVTYTTRPMRDGEVDGIDYHFVSQEKFNQLIEDGFFVEYATYRGWSYGTAKEDCQDENAVAVLTPAGYRALKRLNYNVTSVYVYVDRRSRLIQILARGDEIDEAYRRNLSDVGQFDEIIQEVDYVIDNTGYHMDEEQVLQVLHEILEIKHTNDGYEQISMFDTGVFDEDN